MNTRTEASLLGYYFLHGIFFKKNNCSHLKFIAKSNMNQVRETVVNFLHSLLNIVQIIISEYIFIHFENSSNPNIILMHRGFN